LRSRWIIVQQRCGLPPFRCDGLFAEKMFR